MMVNDAVRFLGRLAQHVPIAGELVSADPRLELDGRVVFVTGAARGLGAEIARQAAGRGARVALVGRRLAPLQELAAELGDSVAAAFEADVSDLAALQRAAADAVERFGGIDVVVANAGIAPPSETLMTIDPAEFERTVDIDLLGQWRTMRATLPAVVERQGHILVVSSVYAFFNGMLNASYAASKAGIEQLVRAVRVELVHHRATAGVAYLGFIDTDLAAEAFAQEHVEEARHMLPGLGFLTSPMPVEDAARAVIEGIERRAARVWAPRWVGPMLAMRGVATTVMDDAMLASSGLARIIESAERRAADRHDT